MVEKKSRKMRTKTWGRNILSVSYFNNCGDNIPESSYLTKKGMF